ncbi:DNA-binding protein [Candidatus Methylocalor cossyra]|uniref:KfrA N-terminal DNA-binding domain-containing protein n=1 Tax=Candidatus Methylocalor cossyra TaxID=3108543 RepID=A0ABM9NMS0_9GAMM
MAGGKKRDAFATYSAAYAACRDLWFQDHLKPTVALVAQRIGIQHTAVIARALRDWKKDVDFERLQQDRLAAARAPEAARDARLDEALAGVVRLAEENAQKALAQDRAALEETRRALEAETAAARAERDRALQEWAAYRAAAEPAQAALEAQLARADAARAEAEAGRRAAEAEAAALKAALEEARARIAQLDAVRAELQAAHTEALQALEARAEAEYRWHLRRIAEEKAAAQAALQAQLEGLAARLRELEPEARAAPGCAWPWRRRNGAPRPSPPNGTGCGAARAAGAQPGPAPGGGAAGAAGAAVEDPFPPQAETGKNPRTP